MPPTIRRAPCLVAALVLGALASCAEPEPHRGPILLLTIDALRADAVSALGGPPGLTPNLDRLAGESDWAERAVAASSWTVPSMASIFTGLQPWRHGNWHASRARLDEEVQTLPEALQSVGYHTTGFRSNTWLRPAFGYRQGFDAFYDLRQGKRAEAVLESLDGGPQFVWVHVLPPHAPYVRWAHLLDRLPPNAPSDLPERVRAADLEPYFDPTIDPDPEHLARFRALYQLHVAHADEIAGRLLEALRRSGHWDDALVVVTADHGEEFGENGQIAHGGSLHRVLLEVPLFVKLPRASTRRLEPRPLVANHRLYATVLELCGVAVDRPEVLPSLFSRRDPPALSELYLGNGRNRFSLVDHGVQILVESRFAPAEPGYFAARRASLGLTTSGGDEASALFARLASAFLVAPPLHGAAGTTPSVAVEPWNTATSRRGVASATDEQLFRRVEDQWRRWNGEEALPGSRGVPPEVELSPADRERLEALGYVVDED